MMFDNIYDNLYKFGYGESRIRIKELLERTWPLIAEDYIWDCLNKRYPFESLHRSDIGRAEIRADEVRCAVYENIQLWKTQFPDIVDEWFDLSIEEQDAILKEAFPSNQVYGV